MSCRTRTQHHHSCSTWVWGSDRGSQPVPTTEGGKAAGARSGRPASTKMPSLLLIISLPLGESALIHFGQSLCLWRLLFLAPEEPFRGSPPHIMLLVLKARHKALAHLGTDGEGRDPRISVLPGCTQVPSTLGSGGRCSSTPDADKPPAQAGSLCPGASRAPTTTHPKEMSPKEPGLRQATSHVPLPPERMGAGRDSIAPPASV